MQSEIQKGILHALSRRYATKLFDRAKKISAGDWDILESSLILSPSGYGLQPWKFLVIQDSETRRRLSAASLGQAQVEDCSHFLVFTAKTSMDESYIDSHVASVAKARNRPKEEFALYFQMMVDDVLKGPKSKYFCEWAARQAYIALGTLLTTAALLGIDSCPLEGIVPEEYDEILHLKDSGLRALAGCALGFHRVDDKYANYAKARFSKEKMIEYV